MPYSSRAEAFRGKYSPQSNACIDHLSTKESTGIPWQRKRQRESNNVTDENTYFDNFYGLDTGKDRQQILNNQCDKKYTEQYNHNEIYKNLNIDGNEEEDRTPQLRKQPSLNSFVRDENLVLESCRFYTSTAYDLLNRLQLRNPIVTCSKSLDNLLGGGILPSSGIYEFYGCPGSGKTQLCMQLGVNVQIPKAFEGCEKQAIYIDTEGSFSPERCYSMAQGIISYINTSMSICSKNSTPLVQPLTPNDIMRGIFVFRIFDELELLALILHLEHSFLTQHPSVGQAVFLHYTMLRLQIGLIIIDSLSFPFRSSSNSSNLSSRLNILLVISTTLNRFATHKDIAIVVTNQMTTRFFNPQLTMGNQSTISPNTVTIIPCLGDSWAHIPSHRLLLTRTRSTPLACMENENDINYQNDVKYQRSVRLCELKKTNGLPTSNKEVVFENPVVTVYFARHFMSSNKASSKLLKRFNDIRQRLFFIDVPHICKEALERLPDLVQAEKSTLGNEIVDTTRTLLLSIIGLQNTLKADNGIEEKLKPNEDLVEVALDSLLAISDQNDFPKFLETLSVAVSIHIEKKNYLFPSIIQWIARVSVQKCVEGLLQRNQIDETPQFTFSDLISSFSSVMGKNNSNYLNIFFGVLLDELSVLSNKVVTTNESTVIDSYFVETKLSVLLWSIQRVFKLALISNDLLSLQLLIRLIDTCSAFFDTVLFTNLSSLSTYAEEGKSTEPYKERTVQLESLVWKLIDLSINSFVEGVSHHRHKPQLYLLRSSESDHDLMKNQRDCNVCESLISCFALLTNHLVSEKLRFDIFYNMDEIPEEIKKSITTQSERIVKNLSIVLLTEALESRQKGQDPCRLLRLWTQLSHSWDTETTLYELGQPASVLGYLLWTAKGNPSLTKECLVAVNVIGMKLKAYVTELCGTDNEGKKYIEIEVTPCIIAIHALLSTPLIGLIQTESNHSLSSFYETVLRSLDSTVEEAFGNRSFITNPSFLSTTTRVQQTRSIALHHQRRPLSLIIFHATLTAVECITSCRCNSNPEELSFLWRRLPSYNSQINYQSFLLGVIIKLFMLNSSSVPIPVTEVSNVSTQPARNMVSDSSYSSNASSFSLCCQCVTCDSPYNRLYLLKTTALHCISDWGFIYGPARVDQFIPLINSLVSINIIPHIDLTPSQLNCFHKSTILLRCRALSLIGLLGSEKLLVPALYRSIDFSFNLNCLASPIPATLSTSTLLSLCNAMSSAASLHLYGELNSSKIINFLEYRPNDPLILRATRLQIFNDLAEEQCDTAVESLKDIQLGLKDEDACIRASALTCLARLCRNDVMDFNKVWAILNSKHYENFVLNPDQLLLPHLLALVQFLHSFAFHSIISSLSMIRQNSTKFIASGNRTSPDIAVALTVLDICLKAIDRAKEITLQLKDPKELTYLLAKKSNIEVQRNSIIEVVALSVEAIGVIVDELIHIARSLTSESGGEWVFSSSYDSKILFSSLPKMLQETPIAIFFNSPITTFSWSSPSCMFRLLLSIVVEFVNVTNGFDHEVVPRLEEACCRMLYYLTRSDRDDLGRKRRHATDLKGPPSPSFSLLSRSLKPFLRHSLESSDPTLSHQTSALMRLVASVADQGGNTWCSATTAKHAEAISSIRELIVDLVVPYRHHVLLSSILPNFWDSFFSGLLGSCTVEEGKGLSSSAMIETILQAILSSLQLSSDHRELLNPILGPSSQITPSDLPSGTNEEWISASGTPDAFFNVLFACTALARRSEASVQASHTVSDLLVALLSSDAFRTCEPSAPQQESSSESWNDNEQSSNHRQGDVFSTSLQLRSACLSNLSVLQEKCPNPKFTIACLEYCLATARPTSTRFMIMSNAVKRFKLQLEFRPEYRAVLSQPDKSNEILGNNYDALTTVGLAISGISSVISSNWPLITFGLDVQMSTLASLCDEILLGNSSSALVAAIADGAIGLCQIFDLIATTIPSELHLNSVEKCVSTFCPFVTKKNLNDKINTTIVSLLGLPTVFAIVILCKHNRGSSLSFIIQIFQSLHESIVSSGSCSFSLPTQAFLFAQSLTSLVTYWDALSLAEQAELQNAIHLLETSVLASLQLPSNIRTQSGLGNYCKPRDLLPSAKKNMSWSSLLSDIVWDKQLGHLLLNGIRVFPFSPKLPVTASSVPDHDDVTIFSTPESLKTLLETIAILKPEDSDISGGKGLSHSRRVRLDFKDVLQSASANPHHEGGILVLGLILQHLKTPIKSPKIALYHLGPGAETSSFLHMGFRLLLDLSAPELHQKVIMCPLRRHSSMSQPVTIQHSSADTYTLQTAHQTISLLLILWRSIYYVDILQDLNLGPSVAQCIGLAASVVQLTRNCSSVTSPKVLASHISSRKGSFLPSRLESLQLPFYSEIPHIRQCSIGLFITLLRLCEIHGLNENRLMQLLSNELFQILSFLSTSNEQFSTQNNNDSKKPDNGAPIDLRCLSDDAVMPRSICFTAISMLPTLCLHLGHKIALDIHHLISSTIPSPVCDPIMWMYYLQQMKYLCQEISSVLRLTQSSSSKPLSRSDVQSRSLTPVMITPALNECCNRLEERLRWEGGVLGPINKIPFIVSLMTTISTITENILLPCLFKESIEQLRKKKENQLHILQDPTAQSNMSERESNYNLIAEFPVGTPSYVINSFNEFMTVYLQLMKIVEISSFIETVESRIPIITIGYLLAQDLLPLRILHRLRKQLICSSVVPSTTIQKDFAFVVSLIEESQRNEIIEVLIRSATLPTIGKTRVQQLLSYIFYQLAFGHSRNLYSTSKMSQKIRSSTIEIATKSQHFSDSNLEHYKTVLGRSSIPIFTSQDLFHCESCVGFLSQQSSSFSEFSLSRAPIVLPIIEPIRLRQDDGLLRPSTRQFIIGIFPYPSCFSPSIEENIFRSLSTINSSSNNSSSSNIQSYTSNIIYERYLEVSRYDPLSFKDEFLSGDKVRFYLMKRRKLVSKELELLKNDGYERIETVQRYENCHDNGMIGLKTISELRSKEHAEISNPLLKLLYLEFGRSILLSDRMKKPIDCNELLKQFEWIYE